MEKRSKVQLAALTLAFAIHMVFLASKFQSRSRRKKPRPSPCYLKVESKPQDAFKRVLASNSYSHFNHLTINTEECTDLHPYMPEISALLKEPDVEALELLKLEFESSDSFVWVETESQLQELAEVLSRERIFALDVEQHNVRSFLGFTPLIQISTKSDDYLVDAIALHDLMAILRPVFANPGICKVFHGADSDVLWLQRDFHIYVVNLFDTAKACHVLSKPQKSLAYLLKTYCGVVKDKQLRTEDWRQRPLPEEMMKYAQNDSHYLLYIAHCLFTELKLMDLESSPRLNEKCTFVLEAARCSNATCLHLFSKVIEAYPGESVASSIISRYHRDQGNLPTNSVNTKFEDLVRRLCAWRDIMARVHDESLRYVLSYQAIVSLAANAPTDVRDICNTISEADASGDRITPSAVVSCHLEEFSYIFQGEDDGSLLEILQNCLGANGSCPLSIYNYDLLSQTSLGLTRNKTVKSSSLARKALQELFDQKQYCKSPVFDNCRIYTSDGRFLSYCARRKLEWYLKKNLAKLVEEDPPAIMLLFEPKQRPEEEDNEFCYENKKNICVGCGKGDQYLRYRIMPLCYIRHLPEHFKSYRYHNIVLLCVDCHEIAHAAGERYKEKIAAEFGIPLVICKVHVDSSQKEKDLTNKSEISASDLDSITAENGNIQKCDDVNISSSKQHSKLGHGSHGKQVVEFILGKYGDKGIRDFVQRWRQDFVEAVHPHVLPVGWTAMHSGN